jgi:sporulation protein YhbH
MTTVFRPYSGADALRSDRSAGDRLRHRQKIREAIRANVADIVAEEAILTKTPDRVVKVPIRGIKEYRFIYGDNTPRVAAADKGRIEKGEVIGSIAERNAGAAGAGDRPGLDYYETEITVEELVDLMFEDLELPELERRKLRQTLVVHGSRRLGYRRVGIRVQLDKKRTARSRIRRQVATRQPAGTTPAEPPRTPFHRKDLRYRRRVPDVQAESNAVVICIMDTSGSMDAMKKYLARSFFFLLYQFVRTRYRNVELAFVAHHALAREVSEEEFFHKAESGGTLISAGYEKALEIIRERYHPSLWNVYAFHCSDGENFGGDNPDACGAAARLCELCNLFGYGEIKPPGPFHGDSSMLELFEKLEADNFHAFELTRKEDIWPRFKALLSRERGGADDAAREPS